MAKPQTKAIGEAKLTAKQEKFARAFVELDSAADAYRSAYSCKGSSDNTIRTEAYKLLSNPYVSHMVEKLKAEAAEKHNITVEFLTDGYLEAAALAKDESNPAALTGAYTALAKLHGHMIDKSQNLNVNVDLGDILRQRMSAAKTIDAAGS